MPRGSGGGVLRAVCSSREARGALLFSLECLDLDLISLSWGLACHRVGSELQGSMQGEAQLVARGEGGRSEWRVRPKGLGRETESKPKGQTWGQ